MKLSSRELALGGLTCMVILLGLSYWFGKPRVATWRELADNRKALERRIGISERVIEQKDEWEKRLDALRTRLSRHPADKDATADYLRILERVARENNVTLARRRARREERHGDLYELRIDCTWEADLDSLVRFLHGLEREQATMDVDDLTIAHVAGSDDRLRGDFTLICVYTRNDGGGQAGEPGGEDNGTGREEAGRPAG